jgi:hypothetical protein
MFVDPMNANSKELYDRSDARWKEIKETQKEKLALERKRVLAAKIEAEATLIKAKNDAKSFEDPDGGGSQDLVDSIGGHGSIDQDMVHDDP